MGLRSRLRGKLKSLLGQEATPAPAPAPRAPAPPASASPVAARPAPAPVTPVGTEPAAEAPEPVVEVAPEPVAEPEPEPEPVVEPVAEPVAEPEPEPEPVAEAAPSEAPPTADGEVTFAADFATSDAPVRNAHFRPTFESSESSFQVRVYFEEEDLDISFPCEPGEYVLEAAERAGFALPYSCRSGGCLTCSAKVHAGACEMGEQYVLEDEHIERGFRLLCLTAVTSDAVFESHQQDNIE